MTPDRLSDLLTKAAAFDHDEQTLIAKDILSLCGPVYGPLDAVMKSAFDENARLTPLLSALVAVAVAAEMGDTRYRYRDSNGEECEGCYLSDALAALRKVCGECAEVCE